MELVAFLGEVLEDVWEGGFGETLKGRLESVVLDGVPVIDRFRLDYPVSDPYHLFFPSSFLLHWIHIRPIIGTASTFGKKRKLRQDRGISKALDRKL